MPAGTLTLTNNSAVVKGAGTAFNTELKAGDFIVSAVGGVTYTLPVKTVDSATQVTLIKAYDGPTQAGAAWYAVPRDAMNLITAQLAAETAKALRGLNLDKDNWQQLFSGTGDITVKLPDGSTFTGPAWKALTESLKSKADNSALEKKADKVNGVVPINQGGTGSSTARNLFTTSINSGQNWQYPGVTTFDNNLWGSPDKWGFVFTMSNGDTSGNSADGRWYGYLQITTSGLLRVAANINNKFVGTYDVWSTRNTTVDGNGFIKKASPIVKLFGDGICEVNNESDGVTAERVSDGVYRVSGTLGFNADAEWGGQDGGIEVPLDRNKQPLIWVDYEVEPTGDLLIKTYHRTYPTAPEFARNEVLGYEEGMPIDIPKGRWVDLRVEMPTNMEK
nr:phage tail protein [uncultured Serratia sp.]